MAASALWQRPIEWARRIGAGERVLKSGLAVAVAWQLGKLVPGAVAPYLAPLTALLVMQVTIADSLAAASQRIFGVIVGVLVAIGVLSIIDVNAITIGIVVMISLMVGSAMKLGPQGVPQVAVSALLVLALGAESTVGFASARILETLIGAAVGLGINALLAPPSHVDAARAALETHATALSAMMRHLATAIRNGLSAEEAYAVLTQARDTDALLRTAQGAIDRSDTALKFNVWHRKERPLVQRMRLAVRALERTSIQARGIVRTVEDAAEDAHPRTPDWLRTPGMGEDVAGASDAVADLFATFIPAMLDQGNTTESAAFAAAGDEVDQARDRMEHDVSSHMVRVLETSPEAWVSLGSVVADLDRIRRELQAALSGELLTGSIPATAPSPWPSTAAAGTPVAADQISDADR